MTWRRRSRSPSQRLRRRWLLALLPLLLLLVWMQRHRMPSPSGALQVIKVIDGDTVVLSDGCTVRYIGIDTPEYGQPYYEAAKNFNRQLVQGKAVELELDIERYDRYGRLLAYLFVRDENGRRVFVNAEMVRNGFALVYTKPPNIRYADLLVQLQKEAREEQRGLWSVYRPNRRPVIASRNGLTFHRLNCPLAKRIHSRNRLRFSDAEEALSKGYHPCRKCQP